MLRLALAAACAAALLLGGPAASAQTVEDWIYTGNAVRPIAGHIQEETCKDLVLRFAGGGEMRIPMSDVSRVEYDRLPLRYGEARSLTEAGRDAEAEESWTRVLEESDAPRGRAIFAQHALYHRAYLRARLGRFAEAAADLEVLLKKFPRSRWFVDAHLRLVRCRVALDQGGKAVEGSRVAVRDAQSLGLSDEERLRLRLSHARALEGAGDWAAATDAFRDLAGDAARAPAIAERARAGEGRTLLRAGRNAEARRVLRELADRATVPAVLASVHNALGDCALASFETGGGEEAVREALFSYLRGVVLYVPGDPEDDAIRARSLVQAGWCFARLREALPTREAREKYRQRALELYHKCLEEYSGTPSARMAEVRRKEIQ